MDHTHQYGKSINILRFSESKEVIVDNKELEKIFGHPEIQDRKVVILSLIGAFRGGKSFFLDYCLRFLYAHFPSINNRSKSSQSYFRKDDNWMGKSNEPLKGFSWRCGTERETIGIDIWSDVFLHTMDRTGEKIAIIVMDTQGLFDKHSSMKDNARIFALGTLISSIQVLNLKQQVQEDHLQYLQFATEFAKFNTKKNEKSNGNPFQNLTFLIRDWENYEEYPYGAAGGRNYLKNAIESTSTQNEELRSVRDFIKQSFENLECCLLPHPGTKITGRRSYDGSWSDMDDKFKEELKNAIEYLLMPERMTIKKINAQQLTVKDIKVYIEKYLKLFQSGDIPDTLTLYQSMIESNMSNLIKKCIDKYQTGINNDVDLTNEDRIQIIHNKWKIMAMKMYDDETKMGNKSQEMSYRAELEHKLDTIYWDFKNIHEKRFRELRRIEAEHQAELEQERKRKELAERARRQKEIELEEMESKLKLEKQQAEERRKYDEQRLKDQQEQQAREKRAYQKRLDEEQEKQYEYERKCKENEEFAKKLEEERINLQKKLDDEKNSFGHFVGKTLHGAGLAVATPFVVLGAEAAAFTTLATTTFTDGLYVANEKAEEGFRGTLKNLGEKWKDWYES
ncbi:atlastin-1-like [Chironomus tepperi]|uniref:atlastin-1-like n=1 Tax=Chironomus tepperi TaxID=113505 RepID=UPI00391FC010